MLVCSGNMHKKIIKWLLKKKPSKSEVVKEESVKQSSRQARPSNQAHTASTKSRPPKPRRDSSEQKTKSTRPWDLSEFVVPPKEDAVRFHDIGLPVEIMHAVHDLKFEYCTPIQSKTLLHAVKGQNVAGKAQTGTGKTAAFLIMIFARFLEGHLDKHRRKGTPGALVLAPTRELVMQIEKDARAIGKYCNFRSVAVFGGMDYKRQQDILERDHVDLLIATPGRLLDFIQRGIITLGSAQTLVIDEADRMLDMGFIPDIKRIIRTMPAKNVRRTMLFSATLTDDVMRLASQWMPDPVIVEIDPGQVAVDTVEQIVYAVTTREKFTVLVNLLKQKDMTKVLIFRNRRDTTSDLFRNLRKRGIKCEMISGAVSQKDRVRVLEDFRTGRTPILVATDVAGRGIHVDDISYVINYDFPYEPEDYVHRIGRTGRAGVKGTAISFACEEESFIIPDIEKYLGTDLPCKQPEESLFNPLG